MDIQYITGFFDGEGCVQISNNGSIALRIINTHLPTLQLIQSELGGSLASRKQVVNKKQYVWSAYGNEAVGIIHRMLPFSLEKAPQMQYALEWMSQRDNYKGVKVPGKKGTRAHPDRAAKIREYQIKMSNYSKGKDEQI